MSHVRTSTRSVRIRLTIVPVDIWLLLQTRQLRLQCRPSLNVLYSSSPDATQDYLQNLAHTSRERMLRDTEFLRSRPDITQRIEDLRVCNEWEEAKLTEAGFPNDDGSQHMFFLPLLNALQDIVQHSSNLRKLSLERLVISPSMRRDILSLENLSQLSISGCSVSLDAIEDDPRNFVPNLFLSTWQDAHSSACALFPALSHLRLLEISIENTDGHDPSPLLLHLQTPLRTVEKLYISVVRPENWHDLILAFESASTTYGNHLRLTHLKLAMNYGMSPLVLDSLLFALRAAPLQCLVLQGIRDGSPDLIERIAQLFPDLLSLTLIYRDSDRQRNSLSTIWPFPTWEYAQRFAHFNRLEHFGWNFRLDTVFSPSVMQFFEDGYPESSGDEDRQILEDDDSDDWWEAEEDWFEPSAEIVKLFAVHCPSLQTMVFDDRGLPVLSYGISEVIETGQVVAELAMAGSSFHQYFATHNPERYMGWEYLPRRDAEMQEED